MSLKEFIFTDLYSYNVIKKKNGSRYQTNYMLNVGGPVLILISGFCYEGFEKRIVDDVGQPKI